MLFYLLICVLLCFYHYLRIDVSCIYLFSVTAKRVCINKLVELRFVNS